MVAGMLDVEGVSGVVIVMLIAMRLDFVSFYGTLFLARERVDYGNALPVGMSIAYQPASVTSGSKVMWVRVHGQH